MEISESKRKEKTRDIPGAERDRKRTKAEKGFIQMLVRLLFFVWRPQTQSSLDRQLMAVDVDLFVTTLLEQFEVRVLVIKFSVSTA